MPTLLFRCPITGHNVQGWIPEDTRADPPYQVFISLRCSACGQMHAVNPATAEVLGTGRSPTR
jgi:hypothetical protein